jgi:photosystem II stability/assembly factor-like uncharacterized protein
MRAWRTWMAVSWAAMALLAAGCGTGSSPGSVAATTSAGTRPPTATAAASASPSPTASSSAVRTSPPSAGKALWLQSLQMSTPSTGWALYFAGNPSSAPLGTPTLLARTTDGARTWTDVTPAAAVGLLSTTNASQVLDAVNAEVAYIAVTASSSGSQLGTTRVFATSDGGQTWTESAPLSGNGYASQLSFTDSRHGWLLWNEGAAMGRNPVRVYRTTDGGAHWSLTAQSPPMNSDSSAGIPVGCDKTGLTFASAAVGWISSDCAAGLSGELLVSRDGGVTWERQQLPVPASLCGDTDCVLTGPEFTDGTGFVTVAAYSGVTTLLVTRDLGQTWLSVPLPAGYAHAKYPYPQLKFFDPEHGVLVTAGPQGTIGNVFYTTSDGGQTWAAVSQGVHFTQNGAAVDFVSPLVGFAWVPGTDTQGSSPAPVYETTNSGRTWTAFNPTMTG